MLEGNCEGLALLLEADRIWQGGEIVGAGAGPRDALMFGTSISGHRSTHPDAGRSSD